MVFAVSLHWCLTELWIQTSAVEIQQSWVVVSFTLKKHSHSDLSQWSAFVLSSVTVFWLTFSCCDQTVTKRFLCLTHPDAEGSPYRSSSRSRGRTHAAYLLPGLCSAAFLIPSRTTCLWWAGTEPAPTPINNRQKKSPKKQQQQQTHTDRFSGQSTKGNF